MDVLQSFQPFQPYLFAGERIVWSGQPKPGIAFSRSDILAIPFSLMWGGFAIFWNYGVWTSFPSAGTPDDWFFKLWGMPFLAAGLYLIVGRFVYDAWIRARTYYAITNERVLILRKRPTTRFISRDIQSLPMLELTQHGDGTGTIVFDSDELGYSMFIRSGGSSFWAPAASATAQFFRIDNPRRAYELIRKQPYA
jgi:hypothetical protein